MSQPTVMVDPVLGNPLAGMTINKIIVNPANTLEIWVAVSSLSVNGTTAATTPVSNAQLWGNVYGNAHGGVCSSSA